MFITDEKINELNVYKFCDTALAFGVLIPAGIVATAIALPVPPVAGAVFGANIGFLGGFFASHKFGYEELYKKHKQEQSENKKHHIENPTIEELYNIKKDGSDKIPSPSFAIGKAFKQLFANNNSSKSP